MVLKKYTLCSIDTLIKVISSLKLVFTDTGFCCQGDVQASVFLAHAGNAVVCDVVSGPSGRHQGARRLARGRNRRLRS